MHTHTNSQKSTISTRRTRSCLPLLLTGAFLVLVLLSIFVTFTLRSQTLQAQKAQSAVSANNSNQQQAHIVATTIPTQEPKQAGSSWTPVKPTTTATISTIPTSIPATPTLIASTPQQTRYGVFPLSTGGPIPVPETVLHPTNIARVMLNSTLISVYAGSMTHTPQIGVLCILREDTTTGQIHITMYQAQQMRGALTILAIQKNILTFTDSTKVVGIFDLNTNQFHW